MTKFELDQTFMKMLGLFITKMPEVIGVENSNQKLTKSGVQNDEI